MAALRTKPDTGTAHTPGTWTVTRSKMATDGAFDYAISAEGVPIIAEAFGRDANGGWPEAEANARLIAAAPDLLEALKSFMNNSSVVRGLPHTARAAAAAIAKAEGRS